MRLALMTLAAFALMAGGPVPKHRPPSDWSRTIVTTPAGTYVRGNPSARVKLVEYLSFTCSHCAAYTAEAKGPLDALVRKGDVSVEVRHAIRDRFDLAAALLARCRGPQRFFAVSDGIFAAQSDWLGKAAALPEPTDSSGMTEALAKMAEGIGLDKVAAPGLPPAGVSACIGNQAEMARLVQMRREAWDERHISGTPTFLVNGQPVAGAYSWGTLEPAIRAALR